MKRSINIFIGMSIFMGLSNNVYAARTDCPVARVVHIQIENNKILYKQEGAPWRTLGYLEDAGTKERYSALLSAQMAGKQIMISYPINGYDCSIENYGTAANIVRTY